MLNTSVLTLSRAPVLIAALSLLAEALPPAFAQTSAKQTNGPASDHPAMSAMTITVVPLPEYLVKAVSVAAGMILNRSPVMFGKDATVSLNLPTPDKNAGLNLLFGVVGESAADPSPEVCSVISLPITVCDNSRECVDVDSTARPTVLCNLVFVEEMDAMFRVIHNQNYLDSILRSDHDFMMFLSRLHRNPQDVITESGTQDIHDMTDHWLSLLVFLLAHELHHLEQGERMHAFEPTRTDQNGPDFNVAPDLRTTLLCRNYEEFQRQGWDLFKESKPKSLESEDAKARPREQEILRVSREVWKSELEADRYAVSVVVAAFQTLSEKVGDKRMIEIGVGHFVEAVALLAMRSWYDRMASFAEYPCARFAQRDYMLTRCLCDTAENYRSVGIFFDDTHPPIYLRVSTALRALVNLGRVPELTMRTKGWIASAIVLEDTAGKLAFQSCLLGTWRRYFAPDANVFTDYSALEGFRIAEKRSFPGTPPSHILQSIQNECFRGSQPELQFELR